MIYVAGLPIVFLLSSMIEDSFDRGAMIGYYTFFGFLVVSVYYLSNWLYFDKRKKVEKINK